MPPHTKPTIAADEAFIVTVGVPTTNRDVHCRRAITVLEQAGYHAGATSDDAIRELAKQLDFEQEAAERVSQA